MFFFYFLVLSKKKTLLKKLLEGFGRNPFPSARSSLSPSPTLTHVSPAHIRVALHPRPPRVPHSPTVADQWGPLVRRHRRICPGFSFPLSRRRRARSRLRLASLFKAPPSLVFCTLPLVAASRSSHSRQNREKKLIATVTFVVVFRHRR